MAKKSKKAKSAVAEVSLAVQTVEEVFAPSPAGIEWNVGVSEEARVAYENKSNGGSKEAEVIEAEIQIPVGGFNRNGMDFMMAESIAPEVIVVNVAKAVKKSRVNLTDGYRGTVRKMLLEKKNGEEIVLTIAAMYVEKGMSYEYGFDRGKRILGDMELELKKEVFG